MSRFDPEKCAKLLKLGRKQYVLRYGVLGWGVPTAILFAIIKGFEEGWATFPIHLLVSLILFPLGGIIFGRCMWRWMVNRCAKAGMPAAK